MFTKNDLKVIKLCNQFVVWKHFLVLAVLPFVAASVIFFLLQYSSLFTCENALFLHSLISKHKMEMCKLFWFNQADLVISFCLFYP